MSDDQNWKPCPQGTLRDVKSELKRGEDTPVMARRAALGILLTAGATVGIVASQSGPEARQLTCSAAMKMAPDYVAGVLEGSDVVSLESHLEHCPKCRRKVGQMRETFTA